MSSNEARPPNSAKARQVRQRLKDAAGRAPNGAGLGLLGEGFSRAWPVDETPCFVGLLEAIDEADRETWRDRDRATAKDES
jgi:hypothetical protein